MSSTTRLRRKALLGLCLGTLASAAWAGACDAPWMHEGGGFTLSAQPGARATRTTRTTRFMLTQFKKDNGDRCSGKLTARTSMTVGGRNFDSESAVDLSIDHGKVQARGTTGSKLPGDKHGKGVDSLAGSTSVEGSGLMNYIGQVSAPGQRLPAMKMTHKINAQMAAMGANMGQVRIPQMTTQTSERSVGASETLQTAGGRLSCWPISYERSTDTGNVQMPGMTRRGNTTTRIVDHFCPATGLVMRQDIEQGGERSSLVVTDIH